MKHRAKRILMIGFPVLFLAGILYFFFFRHSASHFFDPAKTDTIYVTNGDNLDCMTVTHEEDIATILSYMENTSYSRRLSMPWGGYSYFISFCHGEETQETFTFTSSTLVSIGSTGFPFIDYTLHDSNDITMEEMLRNLKHSHFTKAY